MSTSPIPVTLSLPADLVDAVDAAAEKDYRNRSSFVAKALADALDRERQARLLAEQDRRAALRGTAGGVGSTTVSGARPGGPGGAPGRNSNLGHTMASMTDTSDRQVAAQQAQAEATKAAKAAAVAASVASIKAIRTPE